MKHNIRIVFMGTPDFAVATLKALLDNDYNVVGVITAPDKPSGRGQKLRKSAVKQYAEQQDLNILQPTNLKDKDFLQELKNLNANLQIVVAFRMLPKVVWQMPELGTFNLHASLLPDYRGAAPINWAIINGETQTGVTTFFIDEKIDTGEIILSKAVSISEDEDAGQLHDRLMDTGSQLVIDTIKLIETGNVSTAKQPNVEQPKTAYKLNRDNTKIDFSEDLHTIYNKVRGLSPYPTAWCVLKNGKDKPVNVKLYKVKREITDHNHTVGQLISTKKTLKVAVTGGYLELLELQLPGKRKMETPSLLNGFTFAENAKLL